MSKKGTVFVVDDDPAVRRSLRGLVKSVSDVVTTFRTAEEFLDAYDPSEPGCLVLDIRLPGMSGVDLQEELVSRGGTLPVIIITGFAEVQTAVRSMKAGAFEVIEKPFDPQQLIERVQHALEVSCETLEQAKRHAELVARVNRLTPRERQVMELVIAGKPNKIIAADLGLSPKTVEVYRARVMAKTGADSLAELVRVGLALRD